MDTAQLEKLDLAKRSYKVAKTDREYSYYKVAYENFKPLYDLGLLTDCGDLNAFLTCCKWLKIPDCKPLFEKALEDVKSGLVKTRKKDDINHVSRNYINYLIDNLREYANAETRINEIKVQFKDDFQLYDLEAKLFSKTGRIEAAVKIFDDKSVDWNMQKRNKTREFDEWTKSHGNFYSIFYHYIEDNYFSKEGGYKGEEVKNHLDELKLVLSKLDEIIKRVPRVRNHKGSFVIGNAKNLLITYDKSYELIIPREKVFISYARQDRDKWLHTVKKFLKPLENDGLIIWTDEKIRAGTDGKKDIEYQLRSVKVGVLIITQNFLNSDFVDKYELPPLLKASNEGMILIPLICEHCSYLIDKRLNNLDARPDPKFPLEGMTQSEQNKTMSDLLFEVKKYLDDEKGKS